MSSDIDDETMELAVSAAVDILCHHIDDKNYRQRRAYCRRRLAEFMVERQALTRQQIEKHDLPPQPAKSSDPMARGWIESEGNVAWELDALEPQALQGIIDQAIHSHFDRELYEKVERQQREARELIQRMVEEVLP